MPTAAAAMTRDELLALAKYPTVDVPTAGRAFGMGVNASYDAAARGEFPTRVLKLGRKLRVPTADVLAVLGIRATRDGRDADQAEVVSA